MNDENADILQKLAPSIVEIISNKEEEDSKTLGTGFVVTDDGLIATCRHVITTTDSQDKLMNSVKVRFHTDGKTDVKYTASPVREDQNFKDDLSIDIAFLRLDKLPENGVTPVKLDDKVVSLNRFASIGFKKAEEFTRLAAKGEIRIPTKIRISKDVLSPEVIQLYSPDNEIEPGMSGAPVLDIERDRVVGIITERYKEEYNPEVSNMAFALPVESMLDIYSNLRKKNPGLIKFNSFLEAIGKSGSLLYNRFEEVYVPPIEYPKIEETLKESYCVFITGTPEYGKTFTAVKLLWQFYKSGYTPQYFKTGSKDIVAIIEKLVEQDKGVKNHAIYFEDPVGQIEYQPSQNFEEYIGSVISGLPILNVYLIITMREEIYQKFKPLGKKDFREHIKKLNLANRSYDYEKRKEILLKWASIMGCKWLQNEKLRRDVLKYIENDDKLPTPLNIKDFVMETTANRDTPISTEQLLKLIDKQSQRTPERFAREIERMSTDKILFLSLVFVVEGFPVDFIKTQYEQMVKDHNIEENTLEFDKVLDAFKDDKIDITYDKSWKKNVVRFSHPSYLEAIRLAIPDDERVSKTVSDVLWKLADDEKASEMVAYAVGYNLDRLPEQVRNGLLIKLVQNKALADEIARSVVFNPGKVPDDIRNKILLKAANAEDASMIVSYALASNFSILPEDVRNGLLTQLFRNRGVANNKRASLYLNDAVKSNLLKIPEDLKHLYNLWKLVSNKANHKGVNKSADQVIPDNDPLRKARNEALLKAADDRKAAPMAVCYINDNFDDVYDYVRNGVLLKVANYEEISKIVAEIIIFNFDKLPDEVKNLLYTLDYNEDQAYDVAAAVAENFDKLPEDLRNDLLQKLVKRNKAREHLSEKLTPQAVKLPPDIRNKLLTG